MYRNLKAEMARSGVSNAQIAELASVSDKTVCNWLNGNTEMKVGAAVAIHATYFGYCDFAHLFEFTDGEVEAQA